MKIFGYVRETTDKANKAGEQIKTVIEFDGLPHYQSPYSNIRDKEKDD